MDSVDSFTTSDGRQRGYRTLGKGPVLLCHPGGPGFNSQQLGDLGGLDAHFALVILDPRGTGASDPPSNRASYRLDDYVSDIEQLRAHLSLEALTLFGHSHGAFVAVRYAIRYPRSLSRLILDGPLARNAGIELPPIERYFVDWEDVGKPYVNERLSLVHGVAMEYFFANEWPQFDLRHELPLISVPTLVVVWVIKIPSADQEQKKSCD